MWKGNLKIMNLEKAVDIDHYYKSKETRCKSSTIQQWL